MKPCDRSEILERWDEFIDGRSLPYYQADHELMMRQILQTYPLGKLNDLSDRDLLECINLDEDGENPELERSFRYFLGHFGQFLETLDSRDPGGHD